ncbi:PEP-CTERM sorting domain-containing protein [Luteolibacter pohnpeiensis]|uniref:PEP-CTERM sorting domain-containing protein n=1 Tax=Luteolibacter pohnpeiensis TaxID=454153 RepID=A0A934SAI0_9BACT|nr:PEP-CTERM sorting domain-containing protein [Luteolibacter pohnpeiensis]MBK1882642.1 PEP-CTERM sorting domain-containing protein [Luteolibacter pohnpeiensis]
MKFKTGSIAACVGIMAFAASNVAHSAVLFSDTFDVSANSNDVNFEADTGRESGSLATPTLAYVPNANNANQQVGNGDTFPNSGNALLLAYNGGVYLDYDFSTVGTPISITFDRIVADAVSSDDTNWLSLNILANTSITNQVTSATFGILFRANGGTELFSSGVNTTGVSGTNTGLDAYATYTVVLSDLAGSGSAFGTGGSLVTYYEGDTLLGSVAIDQLTNGYIGFNATSIAGIDNLVIESIPEPTSLSLLGLAGCFAFIRRRK